MTTLFIVHYYAKWGIYYSDDKPLLDYLSKKWKIKIIDLQNTQPSSLKDGIVLFRHPHNYHNKVSQFVRWCRLVQQHALSVINPISLIEFGLNKNDFQQLGNGYTTHIPTI